MATATITQAVLAAEMPAIAAWVNRHSWEIRSDPAALTLDASTVHPVTATVIVFHAELSDYPTIPPAWTCRDAQGVVTPSVFPVGGSRPGGPGSIFHPQLVICAPWNRLAYAVHGGPHNDWVDLSGWKNVPGGHTQAHTLSDMLSTLAFHLAVSPRTAS